MGRERECDARVDGRASRGKALLETGEVVFRGPVRARVALRDLARVDVRDGTLRLAWAGGELELDLGAAEAAKWADAIRNPKTRAQKLGVKPGQRVSLVSVKDAGIADELEALGADVSARLRKETDVVLLGVEAPAGLARLRELRAAIAQEGAVWVVSPRGVAGLKDTDVMRAAKAAGFTDVKVVRFSETHTANKLVIPVADRK